MASRGRLAGKASSADAVEGSLSPGRDDAKHGSNGFKETKVKYDMFSVSPPESEQDVEEDSSDTQLSRMSSPVSVDAPWVATPWVLADPLFQDMSQPYRHYLSYCRFLPRPSHELATFLSWHTLTTSTSYRPRVQRSRLLRWCTG